MSIAPYPQRLLLCHRVSRVCACLIAATGAAVLLGWALDVAALKSILPSYVTMKANTALAFLLTGVALLGAQPARQRPRLSRTCGGVVAALGVLTMLEYACGADLGIDELLFREGAGSVATSHPGRMAPNTALCFALLGAALLTFDLETRSGFRLADPLLVVVGSLALLALTGYLYGVPGLTSLAGRRFTHMALHTAAAFLLAAIGLACARPNRGWMAVVTSDGAAGLLLRVVFPAMVLLLVVLGWLRMAGEQAGWYTSQQGTAIFVVVRVILLGAILFVAARIVRQTEQHRDEALGLLQDLNGKLEHRVTQRTAEIDAARVALQSERDFIGTILDVSGALIIVLDRAGNVVRFNRACEQTTGYAAAEVTGKPFWDYFLLTGEREGVRGVFFKLTAGDFPIKHENYWRTKGGHRRLIAWSNSCILDENGAVRFVIGTGIDVTERRRAEDALHKLNQELEQRVARRTSDLEAAGARLARSNRELEQFAYVVSHDLQEPLRKISAFSGLVDKEVTGTLTPQGREYMTVILNAVRRMQALINDLLMLSRVSTQARPFAPVDLGRVLAEVLSDLEPRLQASGGRVEANALPTVEADATQMRQLLQNLVANALKFRKPGVPPLVRVSAETAPGGGVSLVVADNGIGFEPRFAERIFGVFQRLHSREEYEGTGIGLAICQRIAERHGGRIAAEGRPGEGAVFRVELPARQPAGEGEVRDE